VSERSLSALDRSTFLLANRLGDDHEGGSREDGFFPEDTRFQSRWILRAAALPLDLLRPHQRRVPRLAAFEAGRHRRELGGQRRARTSPSSTGDAATLGRPSSAG
jgi:N-terminal domain of (some) glycogen debranching enzymes